MNLAPKFCRFVSCNCIGQILRGFIKMFQMGIWLNTDLVSLIGYGIELVSFIDDCSISISCFEISCVWPWLIENVKSILDLSSLVKVICNCR